MIRTLSIAVFGLVAAISSLHSCDSAPAHEVLIEQDSLVYSFFAAGHVYGNPADHSLGIYPAFLEQISFFEKQEDLSFGVFTGDFVASPEREYIEAAMLDMQKFPVPIYIAPGNHDRGDAFSEYFPEYFTQEHGKDLFIYLAPEQWRIKDEQLVFLKKELQKASSYDKVFIMVHELLWWSPENEYSGIQINWSGHYRDICNYWREVHPLLEELSNDVYLIAGDLGATEQATPYMFHQSDNITFVASGMGGGVADNFLIVDVMSNGDVDFRLFEFSTEGILEIPALEEFVLPAAAGFTP